MDEIKFVLKCFVFAALLLVLTQIKSGETTIEGHIEAALINSEVAGFINKVADGGVKMIKDGAHYATYYATESYIKWKHTDVTASPKVVTANKEASKEASKVASPDLGAELVDQE